MDSQTLVIAQSIVTQNTFPIPSKDEVLNIKSPRQPSQVPAVGASNNIEDVTEINLPGFLESFEIKLGRKRLVPDDMHRMFKVLAAPSSYFALKQSMAEPLSVVDHSELIHISYISTFNRMKWEKPVEGNRILFEEDDASWLFFDSIAHHLEAHTSNLSNGEPKIVVKREESWPVEDSDSKIDFLVLQFGLPRLSVVVHSHSPDRTAAGDYYNLMLQGEIIVRFANTSLDAYKKRDFISMTIFISDTGRADRYFMFQKRDSEKVYRKKRSFTLGQREDRVAFALELYNLSSSLFDESGDEGTKARVDEFVANFTKKGDKLPAFTGRRRFTGEGNHFKTFGYEVVGDGGCEPLSKPLPHLCTVYRRSDPNKTELVAKHVREDSNELAILAYLQTKQLRSPHVIQLIEAIPSTTREWLILPKLRSISDEELLDSRGVSGRVQLGLDLIKGLAYLHEHKIAHRDVKPDNLVCDGDFRLQITGFDVAIEVQNEGTETDEYRGTEGWTAPEMGTEDGPRLMYSPIKTDRWSCGRVLLSYIIVGTEDDCLLKFAFQLVANDPQQRPSLLEWDNLLTPKFSEVTNIVQEAASRARQDMVEVDSESMKLPVAKKRRLA